VNLAKQNKKEIFQLLKKWASSKNKWIRRLAMATIAPYIRVKPNEAKLCLEVVEKLMQEDDKDVRKAIAWALREVSKKDPKAAYEFLQRYASSEDANTRWIGREGSKKLPESLTVDGYAKPVRANLGRAKHSHISSCCPSAKVPKQSRELRTPGTSYRYLENSSISTFASFNIPLKVPIFMHWNYGSNLTFRCHF